MMNALVNSKLKRAMQNTIIIYCKILSAKIKICTNMNIKILCFRIEKSFNVVV